VYFIHLPQINEMNYFNNVLDSIGNTPLIKINKLCSATKAKVLAKVETTNPGNSVKDRMALKMVEDAEELGLIKPGGTIVEGTSGNTGMGLALACIVKGYKLICVLNDKQSKEKMDILRAVGAEVVVCPTAVDPEDPRSYYSVSKRLAEETPNSWYVNQYDNLSNRKAHYESTGPEIWEQTDGKITHFVVGVGTGGTISGVGKFLKEKNPNIKIWGIDTYGSVFKKYHETGIFDENEIYPYITEGIGEDILPENVDFKIIDAFEKVTDKDAAVYTRKLAREEGIFVGNSAGAAIKGVCQLADKLTEDDVVVVLFHDHGSRYIGKIFNDDWMKERGFLDEEKKVAKDIVNAHEGKRLVKADVNDPLSMVMVAMKQFDISQIPVFENGKMVGSISDHNLFKKILDEPEIKEFPVKNVMEAPFPSVDGTTPINEITSLFNSSNRAVIVNYDKDKQHIITVQDMMNAVGANNN
jgi:cystathionine beta-synthase